MLVAPTLVEGSLWALCRATGNAAYDFSFERYFECSHPVRLPETCFAVARLGASLDYEATYQQYADAGIRLIHTPEQSHRCNDLSGWYSLIADLTPRSIILDAEIDPSALGRELGWPIFLKGERQTSRHVAGLSIARNEKELADVLAKCAADPILAWQRMVAREFMSLRPAGRADGTTLPPSFEFRTFWWRGSLVGFGRYWTSVPEYEPTARERNDAIEVAQAAAARINVPFLVVDVAQTATGRWIVIEVNDAQECGYAGVAPLPMWRSIVESERAR